MIINATYLPEMLRSKFPIFEDKLFAGSPHVYFTSPIRFFISTRPLYFNYNHDLITIKDKNENWQLDLNLANGKGVLISIYSNFPESLYFDMYDCNIDVVSSDDCQGIKRKWIIRNITND